MKGNPLERIEIRWGDITEMEADAIVNAANPTLLGGEGVDGMIHWAAGSKLLEECRAVGGCPAGEARITGGYQLAARYVIHAVGPVYRIDGEDAPRLLASCYENSLRLAVQHGIETIAFPAVSCGSYGYPLDEACRIAIDTACRFLSENDAIKKVIFVLYKFPLYEAYTAYYHEKMKSEVEQDPSLT